MFPLHWIAEILQALNHHPVLIIHWKNSKTTYHLATIHPWQMTDRQTNNRWQTHRAIDTPYLTYSTSKIKSN